MSVLSEAVAPWWDTLSSKERFEHLFRLKQVAAKGGGSFGNESDEILRMLSMRTATDLPDSILVALVWTNPTNSPPIIIVRRRTTDPSQN